MVSASSLTNAAKMKRSNPSDCDGCGEEERWFLHNIRHRGVIRSFCTSCVLKYHRSSFCPVCFEFYDDGFPQDRVYCLKCASVTHLDCVNKVRESNSESGLTSSSPYVCPPCANPSFVYFDVGNKRSKNGETGEVENEIRIDLNAAKVLFVAAQISSSSMSKAVLALRTEAEKKAEAAATAKRKAVEALEVVLSIGNKVKGKEKEARQEPDFDSVEAAAERERNLRAKIDAVSAQKRARAQVRRLEIQRNDGVATPSSNGGLKEIERPTGSSLLNGKQKFPKNGVAFKESDKFKEFSVPSSLTPSPSQNVHGVRDENATNGLISSPITKDMQQGVQVSHVMEEDKGKMKVIVESTGESVEVPQ